MKLKSILCSCISAIIASYSIFPCFTFADNDEFYDTNNGYSENDCLDYTEDSEIFESSGVLPDDIPCYELDFYSEDYQPEMTRSLPSYVDLSTDPCFPDLGNQYSSKSCTAFATTYYQFSYEVNKMNGVTSASDRVVYSPKWTYNFINGGVDNGSSISNAYTVLNRYGALKLSDLPFDSNYSWLPGNTNLNSNEMIPQRIEALKTRISSFGFLQLPNSGTIITVPNDSDLSPIKALLSSGKMLVISTHTSFNTMNGVDHNNSVIKVNYRCCNTGNHAMAIVGYDDNVWCDVNGNGIRENCEKGAFKCANSYGPSGKSNDTNGYKWVLYDALNAVSANTVNSWEQNLTGTRIQAFRSTLSEPTFYYINVENKDVYYVGEIDINTGTQPLSGCQYKISGVPENSSTITYSGNMLPTQSTGAYNGKIFFDYDNFCTPIKSRLSGYNWYVKFTTLNNSVFNFKIIDDLQNIIANYGSTNSTATKNVNIATMIGDANIDGAVTMADADLIQSYDAGVVDLSTLQNVLADYNENGVVTISDAIAIIQAILSGGV